MTARAWQPGDIGQGVVEEPTDRRTVFAPPRREASILRPALTTVIAEMPAPAPEPDEPKSREYTCNTCHLQFTAGKRGPVPTACPDHRPRHGRPVRTGIKRRHLPVSRNARSLAQALLSCVESGALVWKTKLGDYLVMRDGREYHGNTLAVAIARSTMSEVEAAPDGDEDHDAEYEQ